jgi:hypothetical protein
MNRLPYDLSDQLSSALLQKAAQSSVALNRSSD